MAMSWTGATKGGFDPIVGAAGAAGSGELGQHAKYKGSSILDPLDIFGYRSGRKLGEAQETQRRATAEAIRSREEMFRRAMAIGEPYRQLGYQALPKMQESLTKGSPLDRLRSDLMRNFMSGYLQKQGFAPKTSEAVTGQQLRRTAAAEDVSRRGRARDVMSLGAGQVAQGAGLMGAYGTSRAADVLAAAAAQAEILRGQAESKQALGQTLAYGGRRLMSDIIAEREAAKYGGLYG